MFTDNNNIFQNPNIINDFVEIQRLNGNMDILCIIIFTINIYIYIYIIFKYH